MDWLLHYFNVCYSEADERELIELPKSDINKLRPMSNDDYDLIDSFSGFEEYQGNRIIHNSMI